MRRPDISHVIFDFDGTLSWLRSGWPDVMVNLFSDFLPLQMRAANSTRDDLRRDILALNGKPSIHQMRRFHDFARKHNSSSPTPDELLELYLRRLNAVLQERIGRVVSGQADARQFVIAGTFAVLENFQARGLKLIILSGTAEPDVKREAALLGLEPYFREHIYGATPEANFSKKQVIDRIIHDERISGAQLLSFGDGPVEIEFTKAVGGLAVGVASDERAHGSGVVDEDKRAHLLRAGADAIIPDYQDVNRLLNAIFG